MKGEGRTLLACMEGIAFVEFLSYELLETQGAIVGEKIFATGGAASSKLGLQIRADILQKSMHIPAHPHSAMGAAILAAAGSFNRGVGEVSKDMVSIKRVIEPSTSPVSKDGPSRIFSHPLSPLSTTMKLLISDLDGTIVETIITIASPMLFLKNWSFQISPSRIIWTACRRWEE